MSSIPHFVIVGAPKCGTTSLYAYLQQHPQVFMPQNKEPRFFCDYRVDEFEFGPKQFHPNIVSQPSDYAALFAPAPAGALTGEASTDYLSVPGVAGRIRAWNPLAKIIIMLRDPIDRAYSEYRHSVVANFQQNSFWESINLENQRYSERYDPIFSHVRRGLYCEGVRTFLEQFGQDHVKIILFDDLQKSAAETIESVFRFLHLPLVPVDVSKRYNADVDQGAKDAPPAPMAHRLAINLLGPTFARKILRLPEERRTGARGALSREQYNSFRAKFVEDISGLESLLAVNLRNWLRPY